MSGVIKTDCFPPQTLKGSRRTLNCACWSLGYFLPEDNVLEHLCMEGFLNCSCLVKANLLVSVQESALCFWSLLVSYANVFILHRKKKKKNREIRIQLHFRWEINCNGAVLSGYKLVPLWCGPITWSPSEKSFQKWVLCCTTSPT